MRKRVQDSVLDWVQLMHFDKEMEFFFVKGKSNSAQYAGLNGQFCNDGR